MRTTNGLFGRAIAETPVAVLDFETTGMYAGYDRVVEVSVVRVQPDGRADLALDTLVNPSRRIGATFVHGITDRDVADAPQFEQIANRVLQALSGCILAAYNVAFDLRFLEAELERVGIRHRFPHLCLMYLRPMLGLGRQCKLPVACRAHGIPLASAHTAAEDALASAKLWNVYASDLAQRNVKTFAELAAIRRYKFTESFERDAHPELPPGNHGVQLKRRSAGSTRAPSRPLVWT